MRSYSVEMIRYKNNYREIQGDSPTMITSFFNYALVKHFICNMFKHTYQTKNHISVGKFVMPLKF